MRRLAGSPVFFIIFTVFACLFSFSLWRTTQKTQVSEQNIQALEQEVAALTASNEQLRTEVQEAGTPLAQEKILRDELLLQKPGEQVVQIASEDEYVPPPVLEKSETTPLQEWLVVLF